jgi:pimeloyl-ACP methyl ester carboxylesterase
MARFGSRDPSMVLLHGLGSSHVHWLGVTNAPAHKHRIHVPDLQGFGCSPLAGRPNVSTRTLSSWARARRARVGQ